MKMKKIFFGLTLVFATMFSAQYYPNNGWGNDGYSNNGNYGNEDDEYYFPDDYYYEYPNDYYGDDYYQSYYNDYRRSISMINWQRFFMQYRLTNWQVNMIMDLNRQFDSYNVWSSYYRMNPNRWYYDRFYALERILGPRVFIVFQNNYYDGYSPVVYYTNRCNNFYRPRYHIAPRYASVNINIFKMNRYDYHKNVGKNYGWNQPRNSHNPGGFKNDNGRISSSSRATTARTQNQTNGLRTQNNNGGFRSGNSTIKSTDSQNTRNNSGGFRNGTSTGIRAVQSQNQAPRDNSGFRSGSSTRSNSESVRNGRTNNSTERISNNSSRNSSERSSGSRSGSTNSRSK